MQNRSELRSGLTTNIFRVNNYMNDERRYSIQRICKLCTSVSYLKSLLTKAPFLKCLPQMISICRRNDEMTTTLLLKLGYFELLVYFE